MRADGRESARMAFGRLRSGRGQGRRSPPSRDDLMSRDPEFHRRASKSTKDRLALRFLKYFSGMNRGKEPSDFPDSEEIPLDMPPEKVLCQQSRKIRMKVLERHPAAPLSTPTKTSDLPSKESQPDANMEPRNAMRHKINDPQSRVQPSPSPAPACFLNKAGAISEGNIQDGSACPEKEKTNMDKLNTSRFPDVQKQYMPACHANTDLSGKKSSSTLPYLHETGIVNDRLDAECNSMRELPENSVFNLPRDSSILNERHRHLLWKTSTTSVVDNSNKSLQRESSKLQNPNYINNKESLPSCKIPERVTGYADSLHRSRNNIIGLLEQNFQNHEASANIPAELLLVRNKLSAYLSRFRAHVGVDSVTGDWATKGFCMKCLDDGASLSCKSCRFDFHEKCLDPLARPKSLGHFYCPFCSYRKALEILQRALKDAKQSGRVFRTLTRMEVPQGHQNRSSSVPYLQEPNLATACGSVNHETSFATDEHQGCNRGEIFTATIEQTGQIDSTQVGDKRKSPIRERVNFARDFECAVLHARKLDDGVDSELELPIPQGTDCATLNRENILAAELVEMTDRNHQVESCVDFDNSGSFHKGGPLRIGEAHHISDAEQEKFLDSEQEKVLSPDNYQPTTQHIENEQQNEAALIDRTTRNISPNEMHAKRRRQDKLKDNISGPIMTLDLRMSKRASSREQKGHFCRLKR